MIWLNESRDSSRLCHLDLTVRFETLLKVTRASFRIFLRLWSLRWSELVEALCSLIVCLLVRSLQIDRRVTVDSHTIVLCVQWHLNRFFCLGLAQSRVHHVLVVVNEWHFALEPWVVVILTKLEDILMFGARGKTCTFACRAWKMERFRVLTQLIEVGPFAVASSVQGSEPTIVLWNVSVSSTAVIGVDNRLWVNMGKSISRPLPLSDKRSYKD